MNKRYEEGRKAFFSNPGEKLRKQYVWGKDEKGNNKLIETEPIDIQAEIESYSDECDIKNIVRKASFDTEFAKSLVDSAKTDETIDITQWPTNIPQISRYDGNSTGQCNGAEADAGKSRKRGKKTGGNQ